MSTAINIIIGLLMFLFLITIHEGGHFTGAKLSGIKVNEFSIGMGPSIYSKQGKETLYSLRALPIGGYVMMEGEESDSEDERSYNNSKPWKKFITILAGPGINLLFAVIVFFGINAFKGTPSTIVNKVLDNSPAQMAEIKPGDKILKINGNNINIFPEIVSELRNSKQKANILILRDNKQLSIELNTVDKNGQKSIGILPVLEGGILSNLKYSFYMTFYTMGEIWNGLRGLVSGALGLNQLSGPVGVIKQVGTVVNNGFESFLIFAAVISINLGFFNLLPIPALDGSKLLFIICEMIIGKPINRKFEERITIVGFIFLLGLILLVTIKDVISLF
ncbi:RIP metalloprotease RseP [Helcococcus ovis]|uniref:Zinc metalloprotease n=3 Tax=Helcococcus ovis TaxID=72026 RepID=A0A4R9C1Q9_9FIRM|nr:RIP metalloprotease RseP [Helcococcus ovis]TFF65454.1 RIP metalloprotease RseP [Helcococcus ovis]TFF66090.1 RIP metalloprotease RseP [Helcococcus ovis]TFF67854.1 RIP metalloprotease RseP [Helcococcus ovis]WNZ02033.1 RIP metalloprotease RseP [Helcococcus ovis]